MSIQLEKITAGHYLLKGELDFNSVFELWQQQKETIFSDPSTTLKIDLHALNHSNSAGLALLLEWYRMAEHLNKQITYINLPKQMLDMAKVSGLDEVLPIA